MFSLGETEKWVFGEVYVVSARCSYGTLYVSIFAREQMVSLSFEMSSNFDLNRGLRLRSASRLTELSLSE
jgi:hypothetical protein